MPLSRIRARLRPAARQVGHRGAFLILLGIFDIFYGAYLAAGGSLGHSLLLPERPWGWAWIGTGALLILGGTRRRDGWFFCLAAFLKLIWAGEYFRAQSLGQALQWTRGAYFLAFGLIVLVISSWPEDGSS
jgi:hypothetical protein